MALAVADIAATLREKGWAVAPRFFEPWETKELRAELGQALAAGQMRHAGVGRGQAQDVRQEIRGDQILWLDPAAASPAQRRYMERMNELRVAINRETFLGLFELESHFAIYPAGTHYAKHLDRFRDDDARVVSCILYLNETWTPEFGGQLRLFLGETEDSGVVDIAPEDGTLVVFLSDRYWHEVRPTTRDRVSLTGWFRTRS
jgi:SM-20-related protein